MRVLPLFILFFLFGCAQINILTGGSKDTTAPEIDSAKTYPISGQTNYTGNLIQIKFKEYIRLNNPNENIIITPQLSIKPSISSHNKKLSILFNEELQPNTTYTISFNGAVQDITEKNDSIFQFVFSTGDYIDSLSVSGRISDGFTNQAEKDFLIALYPVSTKIQFDSIPYIIKPTYIGQTNKSGEFKLNYLKGGEYYLFVIKDLNRNLLLDTDEKFGFYQKKSITIDSTIQRIEIKTFYIENDLESGIEKTNFTYPGKLSFILTNSKSDSSFSVNSTIQLLKEETNSADSLVYWLADHPTAKMRFNIDFNGELDTLKPLYKGTPERGKEPDLKFTNNVYKGKLLPNEDLKLLFSEPINNFDLKKIHFIDSDSNDVAIEGSIINVRTIVFSTSSSSANNVTIDSAAFLSIYGKTNESAQVIYFENYKSSYYGSLKLNIDTLFTTPVYIELIDNKGEIVIHEPFSQNLEFLDLVPGKYVLRLIFDENNDSEWTTGSLVTLRLPEHVIYYRGEISIKSKWEKEIDWELKKIKDGDN